MPDSIRKRASGIAIRALGSGIFSPLAVLAVVTPPAHAEPLFLPLGSLVGTLNATTAAGLALTLGAAGFAAVTAVLLMRGRSKALQLEEQARSEIASLRAQIDRSLALLTAEPQVFVIWAAADEEPEFIGDAAAVNPVPIPRRLLSFGTWLPSESAHTIEQAVVALRQSGQPFVTSVETLAGRQVEIEGRAVGGRAILRLRDVGGAALALAELRSAHMRLISETEPLRALAERLPAPIWTRDAQGRLNWANPAYAQAVEAASPADAVERQVELLDRAARDDLASVGDASERYAARLPAVLAGQRRMLDVLDVPTSRGRVGIGIDVTEIETLRAELVHMMEAHRRTLDQLPTAVAIFSAGQRLTFCNVAYRALWELDADFLEGLPSDAAILDRLRAARKLPEQLDFRQWRTQLFEAYRALEPKEHWWHLPDGRTLRVVTTPNPEGGITYVFDDVTERLDLERRYDSLIRVQGETLENLVEAVVVFGSDGRLSLHNSAFVRMWNIPELKVVGRPHIQAIIAAARPLYTDPEFWQALQGAVTGLEGREALSKRLERIDGSLVDCATVPLPDGATLVCFQDVTDTVNVERALRERNDALEAADHLKNDFVHHVSYELRTPLTNIIGFAHLLRDLSIGPLTDKQREYLGYISSSSGALLAIINDILDLASIDAGAMQLDLGPVDIRKTMEAAAEGVRDRLTEQGLTLDIRAPADIGTFTADERRIRQILFNLLSNAIVFSLAGGTITLTAERRPDSVVFTISDRGRGIPAEIVERVFNRFETHSLGSQHRGTGLGLSIVRSFVELHGGAVKLDSVEGKGTTVACIFPLEHDAGRIAAE